MKSLFSRYFEDKRGALTNLLAVCGLFYLTRRVYSSWKTYSIEVLNFGAKNIVQRYGAKSWALITDISTEYGREFARQLAARDFKLLLLAPDNSHFDALIAELKQINAKVVTMNMVTNFKTGNYILSQPEYKHIFKQLDISMVINTEDYCQSGSLDRISDADLVKVVNSNVYTSISLASLVLPNMLQREQKSIMVEVSNTQVNNPRQGYQTYAAAKSFSYAFAQCLTLELYREKIDFLVLRPFWEGSVSVKDYVASAIKKFGRTVTSHGHPVYYYQSLITPDLYE